VSTANAMRDPRRARSLLVAVISLAALAWRGAYGFEWPAVDVGPFLERLIDPGAYPGDFYAASSTSPNPRWVFNVFVLALVKATGLAWPEALALLKIALACALPVLFLAYIERVVAQPELDRGHSDRAGWIAAGAVAVLALHPWIPLGLSVAWFACLDLRAVPQNVALAVGLAGALVAPARPRTGRAILFAATLLHPTIGLSVLVFHAICTVAPLREHLVTFASSGLAPCVLLQLAFRSRSSLDTREFIEVYVLARHPHHYHVPELAGFAGLPWWTGLALVTAVSVAALAVLSARHHRRAVRLGVTGLAAYLGALACQWLFIDVLPVKVVAVLGPVRFCIFGPWICVILVAVALAGERTAHAEQVSPRPPAPVPVVPLILLVAVAFALRGPSRVDELRNRLPALHAWLATTPRDAVLAVPPVGGLDEQVYFVGKRGLVAPDFFPFREDAMREFFDRQQLAYGDFDRLRALPVERRAAARNDFHHALPGAGLATLTARYRVDFIVFEAARKVALDPATLVFEGDGYRVHAVRR
jgi:hypothetical protein